MASMLREVCVLFVLGGAAVAQNDTVPSLLSGLEGGSGTAIPFGIAGAARVQYIYDSEDLPWSGPRMVSRVSFRADNPDSATTFAAKGYLFVSILLSTTSARAETASATFADNYGTDAMVVVDNVPVILPAQPAWPTSSGPRPANIDFILPTPWFHGLTPARDGHEPRPTSLLIEVRVHSQPAGSYRLDNIGNCSIPPVSIGTPGPACHSVGLQQLTLTGGNSMMVGSSYGWQIQNAEPNAAVLLFLGVAPQTLLANDPALPLPVPLWDASNPTGMPPALGRLLPLIGYSAPDCFIEVAPTGLLFGTANAGGVANLSIALSPSRSFVGGQVYAQAIAHAQTANAMQVVTSAATRSTVCGPLGVARIYALGSDNATVGQWSFGQGAVVELH